MKVDSDTFFLREALLRILCDHDPRKTLTFTSYVHVETLADGALEDASRGVLRKYGPGALFEVCTQRERGHDFQQQVSSEGVKHMGGEVVQLPLAECTSCELYG